MRRLDLRSGLLERELIWRAASGHAVQLTSRRLVSLSMRSVAAISYEVEAIDEPMRVALQSNLLANTIGAWPRPAIRARPRPRRRADARASHAHDGLRVVLGHTTTRSELYVASGMDHVIDTTNR